MAAHLHGHFLLEFSYSFYSFNIEKNYGKFFISNP